MFVQLFYCRGREADRINNKITHFWFMTLLVVWYELTTQNYRLESDILEVSIAAVSWFVIFVVWLSTPSLSYRPALWSNEEEEDG